MGIEIFAIGGYNEVGKNCTAIKVDDEIVICDMGLHIENYIKYTEDEDVVKVPPAHLMRVGAVPNITKISAMSNKVIAIIPTHAHLDHVGAIPYLSNKFNAPIYCTPYTAAVLESLVEDKEVELRNKVKILNPRKIINISNNIKLEFIAITHSTPQTVMILLYTKYGKIIYANDFKFDNYPVLGEKADIKRLQEVGKDGILALICDSTYAKLDQKMPSESVAREMLKDVILGVNSEGRAIIITTFSSHIARLKSIVEFGKKTNRQIIFMGRSLRKYVQAAEDLGIAKFSGDVKIIGFSDKIKKTLKKISKKDRSKYIFVVTGHQGEHKAVLTKMVHGVLPFKIEKDDHVIFSCRTIPSPTNIKNRKELEDKLKKCDARIFKDIHVSGHAAREDLRDLIDIVKPKHVIPAHGDESMRKALADLVHIMGLGKTVKAHLMRDGDHIRII